jgi:ribosomal protein S12 methylthiotransferase accessory factor
MTCLLKRIKPYKANSPAESVNKIKTILNGLGFQFVEEHVDSDSLFKAASLSIINPLNNQIVFSTYGKGNSSEWVSASAWGEMIERIQNLAFYMILIYPSQPETKVSEDHDFRYYPDEKIFSLGYESNNSFTKYYKDLVQKKHGKNFHNDNVTCIPFYSLFQKKTVYLPFRALQVIAGSNGMCSGNTREEALIQGISEIFERFLLKAFYQNPFCPPDIPLSCFEGTEIGLKIIHLTQKHDFKIQIKDCSLGKDYPVIGVLIKNSENCYAFHLGADPSPVTALERCFTEMFQGGAICFQSIEELNNNLPFNLETDFWKKNLSLTIKAYAGQWPPSILGDNPSCEFTGFEHPDSVSDHDDLMYLLNILKNENREVLVRDNSFLGQPSYYIYIPGMSEMTTFPDNSFSNAYLDFDRYLPVVTSLKKSTKHKRSKMMKILPEYIRSSPDNQFKTADYFKFYQEHPVARLASDQFLDLINFSLLEGNIPDNFTKHEINANPFLNALYEKDCTFKPSEVFHKLNIPDCFECDKCKFSITCNLPYLLTVWKSIKECMKYPLIDQINSLYFADL